MQLLPAAFNLLHKPTASSTDAHVLDAMRVHGFFGAGRHEDLNGVVVIAVGALVERARRARIRFRLSYFYGRIKCRIFICPKPDC